MANSILACDRRGSGPFVQELDLASLSGALADPDLLVWVDLDNQGEESEIILREIFEFHPLMIEDAFADAPTPKAEASADRLYLVVHGLIDDDPEGDGEVHTADVDFFIGADYLITHRRRSFPVVEEVQTQLREDPSLLRQGPASVAHRIIDRMVDDYLPLMEKLDREIDSIEEAILKAPEPELLPRIFRMKHSLQRLRRVGLHQRQLLLSIASGQYSLIPEDLEPFFRDVYDHFVKVTDLTEAYRDLMASSLDAHLSMQSHRLNEVMRVLTIFSTVMLPLTFITGLYGMNFDYMPGLHWRYGYETAMLVMVGTSIGMLLFFRRRKWI